MATSSQLDLAAYMSTSIRTIMAKAYKSVLSNPREAKFAYRMQTHFQKSEKRRKKGEQDKRQQIVSLTPKGKALEEEAFTQVPAGMNDQLSACPMKFDDYQCLAQELDSIINTLKK